MLAQNPNDTVGNEVYPLELCTALGGSSLCHFLGSHFASQSSADFGLHQRFGLETLHSSQQHHQPTHGAFFKLESG